MFKAALVWILGFVFLAAGFILGMNSLATTTGFIFEAIAPHIPLGTDNSTLAIIFLGFGLLIMLGGLVYFGDTVSMMDKKVKDFESKFPDAVENLTQSRLRKERSDSQRDLAEGVHSVLHSPLTQIRSHVSMFSVGLSREQQSEKVQEIVVQLDRVDKFLASLRRSNNPGQISQVRCEPEKVLKTLLPDWLIRARKYGASVTDKITYVHEIGIPERDVKTIMRGVLEFFAERLAKNLYKKNVLVSLQPEKDGIHFSILDNQKVTPEEFKELQSNMHLAIASGTLERNYCSLEIEEVLEGGLRISFDLVKAEDQTLDSLTAVSRRLKA